MIIKFIVLSITWSVAMVFVGTGIYAWKSKDPIGKPSLFWNSEVPVYTIKDIPAYNRANCKMWCLSSIPYWISGLGFFWSYVFSISILLLGITFGTLYIAVAYRKIERKYKI